MRTLVKLIIVSTIFFIFSAQGGDCNCKGPTEVDIGENLHPGSISILKGISPHYILYKHDYRALLDMVAAYGGNMTRIFAFGSPDWGDDNFWPWQGQNDPIDNLDPAKIQLMKDVISYANSKGIVVMLCLFHTNSGFGEWVWGRPDAEKESYIQQMIQNFPTGVIFQTGNEMGYGQQSWILDKLKKYGANWTASYSGPDSTVDIGATVILRHMAYDYNYFGGGVIQSNDSPLAILGAKDSDYIRIMDKVKAQGKGGFEWLVTWKRNMAGCEGEGQLRTPEEIKACWGGVLEYVKTM